MNRHLLTVSIIICLLILSTIAYAMEKGEYAAPSKVAGSDAYEFNGKVYSYSHAYKIDVDKDGTKETDVKVYKYDQNTKLYRLVTSNKSWAWFTKSADTKKDYTIIDSDCDGKFDQKLTNDEDYNIPSCIPR